MNYYINGNAAKAEQIKAAFEKLGYDISWPEGCANPDVINIGIERNGAKYVVAETSEYIKDIIKTHPDYKELELPIEPKFKVGDSIVNDYCFGKVIEITNDAYLLDTGQGIPFSCEHNAHLWSIQDAKNGDVLATDNGWTCIFQAFYGCGFSSYCFMDSKRWFCEFGSEVHTLDSRINGNIHPATKEQRDLLFAKMKEAGYQWDADKKELRKIQQHYDISNFYAGMPVLVRDDDGEEWNYLLFSHYRKKLSDHFFAGGNLWFQCIPFNDDTKHLLGTTDMCDEEFINW